MFDISGSMSSQVSFTRTSAARTTYIEAAIAHARTNHPDDTRWCGHTSGGHYEGTLGSIDWKRIQMSGSGLETAIGSAMAPRTALTIYTDGDYSELKDIVRVLEGTEYRIVVLRAMGADTVRMEGLPLDRIDWLTIG